MRLPSPTAGVVDDLAELEAGVVEKMLDDVASIVGRGKGAVLSTIDSELDSPKLLAMLSVSDDVVDVVRIDVVNVVSDAG